MRSPKPKMARMRAPLEHTIEKMLHRYTMHDILHAMVESCYRRAGSAEQRHHDNGIYTSPWREVGRYLTGIESAVAMLELR